MICIWDQINDLLLLLLLYTVYTYAYTVEQHFCSHEIQRLAAIDGGLRPYPLGFHVMQAVADAKLI